VPPAGTARRAGHALQNGSTLRAARPIFPDNPAAIRVFVKAALAGRAGRSTLVQLSAGGRRGAVKAEG